METVLSYEHLGDENPVIRWSSLTRVAFRFVFCYLVLYCLYLADALLTIFFLRVSKRLPSSGLISPLWHVVVPWVGQHILHLHSAITVFSNGSGDTTYDYVLVLCELLIAAVATVFWTILDGARPNYRNLHQWLRLVVRLSLGAQMISYGMDKAIPLQFMGMPLSTLTKPFGEMSPSSLLWSFMGASTGYTMFSGVAEVLGGILILLPPTVTLGALVSLAAMTNVLALDLSYDVPVKLMAFHLVLLAAFLLISETRRLADVLVFNRSAEPVAYAAFSKRSWVNRVASILPLVWGVFLLSFFMFFNYKSWSARRELAADHGPLYGVWIVEQFSYLGPTTGPLFTAKIQQEMEIAPGEENWQRVLFESSKTVVLQLKGGVMDQVDATLNQGRGTLVLTDSGDQEWRCTLSFRRPTESLLSLQGSVNACPFPSLFAVLTSRNISSHPDASTGSVSIPTSAEC